MSNEVSYFSKKNENEALAALADELTENTLSTRMKCVIYAKTDEKRRFPRLEGLTKIPITTWRSWWKNGVTPSGVLVEAIARQWPEHAYWLITGMTDRRCGHVSPKLPNVAIGHIVNWPEPDADELDDQPYSKTYLRSCLDIASHDDKDDRTNKDVLLHALPYVASMRFDEIKSNFEDKDNRPMNTISKGD